MFDIRWLNNNVVRDGNVIDPTLIFDFFLKELGINTGTEKEELLELDEKHRKILDDLEKVQYKIKHINKEHEELRLSLGMSYEDWIKEHHKSMSDDDDGGDLRLSIYKYLDVIKPLLGQEMELLALNEQISWRIIGYLKSRIRMVYS